MPTGPASGRPDDRLRLEPGCGDQYEQDHCSAAQGGLDEGHG
jgi:hypothetical protein